MRYITRFTALILVFLIIVTVCGCGDSTEKAYIYFELPKQPSTVDAQTASTDAELLIVKNIYEGLLRKNEDGEIDLGMAESYTKKGLTYTFKLREDAVWSNGDKVTAHDFEFAFKRAVSPETKSPFVSRLFCISGAEDIYNGKASADTLAVKAESDFKLEIKLSKEDDKFLETLTTSVAMPCNQKFFEESGGKYGLFKDNIISNGSYRLTKWNKESFGIRLYKNSGYTGNFEAKNAAVFLSCDKDATAYERLSDNDADIAFIDSSLTDDIEAKGFKTVSYENICWFLTVSGDFPEGIRKSLAMLVGGEVYSSSLESGYSVATSMFPNVISEENIVSGIVPYNLEAGKELYSNEVLKLEGKKFPSSVVLYYYDNGVIKPVVTDVVGHWQNKLGAFVNIEAASSASLLTSQLTEQTYSMAIFPVRADSPDVSEFLKKFGIDYNGENLNDIQAKLLRSNNIIPLAFQNTTLAYSSEITEIYTECGNGYIDFAFIIKHDKD